MGYPFTPHCDLQEKPYYFFVTDKGLSYVVEFYRSMNHFDDDVLYNEGKTFEVNFRRLDSEYNSKSHYDPFIAITLRNIILFHIQQHDELNIYTFLCDSVDLLDKVRSKYFRRMAKSKGLDWKFISFEILPPNPNGSASYLGVVIHQEHPNFFYFLMAFHYHATLMVAHEKTA
ncbi:hypothetical protein LX64_04768 [Chitinophaga skermanii]|uniref:Uncharacterized protein n=1 Tax=Chitinophaga skermanii TaxID=331697 RepID=A0A327Q9C8_9BACT|nr:hypothetical protein [Chitinophaga skermanii]RAI98406.1 hypothetical protein LX64_04768 [Chitinophaga skermanii]